MGKIIRFAVPMPTHVSRTAFCVNCEFYWSLGHWDRCPKCDSEHFIPASRIHGHHVIKAMFAAKAQA